MPYHHTHRLICPDASQRRATCHKPHREGIKLITRKSVTIINKTGLHARPASLFTRQASAFQCDIKIRRMDEEDAANAKSIIMLLSLGLGKGTEVEIIAEGLDETEAVDALVSFIQSGCGEEA